MEIKKEENGDGRGNGGKMKEIRRKDENKFKWEVPSKF